jgi:hypothetical protein
VSALSSATSRQRTLLRARALQLPRRNGQAGGLCGARAGGAGATGACPGGDGPGHAGPRCLGGHGSMAWEVSYGRMRCACRIVPTWRPQPLPAQGGMCGGSMRRRVCATPRLFCSCAQALRQCGGGALRLWLGCRLGSLLFNTSSNRSYFAQALRVKKPFTYHSYPRCCVGPAQERSRPGTPSPRHVPAMWGGERAGPHAPTSAMPPPAVSVTPMLGGGPQPSGWAASPGHSLTACSRCSLAAGGGPRGSTCCTAGAAPCRATATHTRSAPTRAVAPSQRWPC